MKNESILVLKVEAKKLPSTVWLSPTAKAFADAINEGTGFEGDLAVKKLAKGVYIVFNRDGFLFGLPVSRSVGTDIIMGRFFVVATDDRHYLRSLSKRQVEKYSSRFEQSETITEEEATLAYLTALSEDIPKM